MKIVIIGAGNLATNLAHSLNKNHKIVQIVSKTIESAEKLAKQINSDFTNDINSAFEKADLYIIATNDSSIKIVVDSLIKNDKTVVHTAGSISIEVLKEFSNHGVFYPLQTFSKNKILDFNDIPICIEANNKETNNKLSTFAKTISSKVYSINSEERKYLHLAAVFACNFTNHLYNLSNIILNEKDIDFEILKPLIKETADKITDRSPADAQTGPAIRNDNLIIEKHLELLSLNSNLKEIYNKLTESIIKTHIKNGEF